MKQQIKFKQTEIGEIPEVWEVKQLGDFISLERGVSYHGKGLCDNGIPMVNLGTMSPNSRFLYNGLKYYCGEFKERNLVKPGDIVIANTDITQNREVLGAPAIIPNDLGSDKILFTHHIYAIRNKSNLSNRFLYYLLQLKKYKDRTGGFATGTTVLALPKEAVLNFVFGVPTLEEQESIANFLDLFYSKIELNRQMNKTLEAIGQTLFKHWFIDRKDIPQNWETKQLDEIAEFLNGLALQKYPANEGEEFLPVIKIKELRSGVTDQTDKASLGVPKNYIIKDGDILFSWSGSLEIVIWTNGKGALNQHLFKVSSEEYPKWFYYFWTKNYIPEFRKIAEGKATTMGHIQRHHLSQSQVIVPDKNSLEKMNKIMAPLFNKMILLNTQSNNLSQLRDSLLPKLMSGKIRVSLEHG